MSGFDVVVSNGLAADVGVPRPTPIPSLLLLHDLEGTSLGAATRVGIGTRARLRRAGWERRAVLEYDGVVTSSAALAEAVRLDYGAPDVRVVPGAVDPEEFASRVCVEDTGPELVFVGPLDRWENREAVHWFTQQVWPQIRAQTPGARCTIVGPRPPRRIQELCFAGNNIEIAGAVPDIRPFLDRARAAILPHRAGHAPRLWAFEAMAMGRPVVATREGASGLGVGADAGVFVAQEAKEFAAQASLLLQSPERAAVVGEAARTQVGGRTWDCAVGSFLELVESSVRAGARERTGLALRGGRAGRAARPREEVGIGPGIVTSSKKLKPK